MKILNKFINNKWKNNFLKIKKKLKLTQKIFLKIKKTKIIKLNIKL